MSSLDWAIGITGWSLLTLFILFWIYDRHFPF